MRQEIQNSKKISIAIPTYNRLDYLKETINSILNQTFQDFSIFIFDNASDQPIEEELKKINDNRINFIGNKENIGAANNINRILDYPFKSEYLLIFHDDDLMHPRMLEMEVSFLEDNKEFVFLVSRFNKFQKIEKSYFQDIDKKKINYTIYLNNREFLKSMMTWSGYAFSSAMYRLDKIKGIKMNFDKFSDFADQVFLLEASRKGPTAMINVSLLNYRIHPGQDSKQLKKEHEDGIINTIYFFRNNLNYKKHKKLFNKYSINFLIRSYSDINKGFFDFLRFIKKCRRGNLIKYSYFFYLDVRGLVSLISIVFKKRNIINILSPIKDYLRK